MPNLVDLRKSGGVATRRKQSEPARGAARRTGPSAIPPRRPSPWEAVAPAGEAAPPRFVIQEHHARALHWDLRLERDGVLASWALPKGLPDDPKRNHLAVHTEDHPLEYATFSGDIPAGEYGGGTMTIWDSGTYETEKWTDTGSEVRAARRPGLGGLRALPDRRQELDDPPPR